MAFSGAASNVVAKLFRLVNSAGVVIAELGTRVSAVFGGPASAFSMYHLDPASSDSALSWTQNTTRNETDLIGPGPLNGLPPSVALTYSHIGIAPMGARLFGGNGTGPPDSLPTDGAEIVANGRGVGINAIALVRSFGSVSGKDVGIRAIESNSDASAELSLFGPTVPIARDWQSGTNLGYVYGVRRVYDTALAVAANLPNVAAPGPLLFATPATDDFKQIRDRALWDINASVDMRNNGTGWGFAICYLVVAGGSFGGGTTFGSPIFMIDMVGGPGQLIFNRWLLETTEVPGTQLTFSLGGIKTAAGGVVTVTAGNTKLTIIRNG